MACPKCGCKVHYQYDSGWDDEQCDESLERCAACGEVFDIGDAEDDDDDMATDDSKPARGWHAQWQPRCDCCGRFVTPGAPGSSWVHVPDSHVSVGDDRERCAACTKKRGPAKAMPGYVEHLVQGVVPDA